MSGSILLIDGNVFARKMWAGLPVLSEVEVLEGEDGEAEGEETGKSERSEESAMKKVEICCDEG